MEDLPGTTRDRLYGEAEWSGVSFTVIDTGGLEAQKTAEYRAARPGVAPLARDSARYVTEVTNQARIAVDEADAIVFVVDGKDGLTAADEDLAEYLQQTTKPVLMAVNKTESEERQLNAAEFWSLGLGEPFAISAFHGIGVGDLLDVIAAAIADSPVSDEEDSEGVAIALVGRPNVGKSSLLNTLIGHDRAIVSQIAGTTRDPIDTKMVYNRQEVTLIDTAGIRRRGRVEPGIEKYSVLRSMRSIDRADVALLLLDGVEGVTAQDAHIAGYVLEAHKSVIVLVNKWDIVEKNTQTMVEYTREVRADLQFLDYVPVLFISALTKQRVQKVMPTALEVAAERRYRIPTAELNGVIQDAYHRSPPATKQLRPLRIYYATQASVEPPTFVLFVNDPELAHFSYLRYLENQLRRHYPFVGTPIRIRLRPRSSRKN